MINNKIIMKSLRIHTSPPRSPTKYLQLNLQQRQLRRAVIILKVQVRKGIYDTLTIFQDSNPYTIAQQFVKRNKLPNITIDAITRNIERQMEAYNELSSQVGPVTPKKQYSAVQQVPPEDQRQSPRTPQTTKKRIFPPRTPPHRPPTFSPFSQDFETPSDRLVRDHQRTSTEKLPEYITDRVLVKRLFSLLDHDSDGLISSVNCKHQRLSSSLTDKIMPLLAEYGSHVTFEYEDFYRVVSKDGARYFEVLKCLSEFFGERLVMVAVK